MVDVLPMLVTNVEYMIGLTKVSIWAVVVTVTTFLHMNSFMPLDSITNRVDQTGTTTLPSCGITSERISIHNTTSVQIVKPLEFHTMVGVSCIIGMEPLVLGVNVPWNQRYVQTSRCMLISLNDFFVYKLDGYLSKQ